MALSRTVAMVSLCRIAFRRSSSGRVAAMRFPDFDLPRAGGGTLALGDMLGRPWIAYLARHPG